MGVANGMFTMDDLLAAYPQERALGRIKLVGLLAAQPEMGHTEATRRVEAFRLLAAHRFATKTVKVPQRPTVAYLRHQQAGEALLQAWYDAITDLPESPWEGFPHQASPSSRG